ncbi:MAG: hypothetical protein IJV82_05065 [Oscillospiraceae bacterium]|nr:hypothetical protein [Oscillospiraceae bacterium]
MKIKKKFKSAVAFALCLAMILGIVAGVFLLLPSETQAAEQPGNNFNITNFQGKKLSIIGDSISTYEGVSNNTAYNATIGGNAVYYGGTSRDDWATAVEPLGVSRADTWWQQTIDTLGMELCVNNSWSGSKIKNGTNANSGCVSRCRQLHNVDGEKPDIIAIYLGTNDCNSLTSTDTLGTPSDSMYNTVTKQLNNTSYAPSTILGAYSLMIARAKDEYPNAEIYCFTLLHKIYDGSDANDAVYEAFNAGVKTIADHYGCYVVDLYNESGIHEEKLYQEYCLMTDPVNSLHPYPAGMDAITNCFISSMMKNSQYMTGTTRYSVRYDLTNTYVQVGNMFGQREMFGDVTTAMAGKPFQVALGTAGVANIDVTVTMGGVDITQEVVHGDVITIDSVTGDIVITATEFDNFYWYADTSDYISNPDFDATFSYNDAAQIRGTYNTNGVFGYGTGCSFKLSEPAMLLHDRPWILEFKATGVPAADYPDEGFKGGILLTSDSAASDVNGNTYIHLNQSQLLLGHRDSGYNNTGYGWDQIAAKVGSSSGDLFRNETHVYRLENKVNADGANMVYLTVDGTLIGAMNKGEATASEISGRDYMINYLGTSNHPLQSCNIHYMKIFENGEPDEQDAVNNFRWDGIGESLTTMGDGDFFTENVAKIEMGTGVHGVHPTDSYYSLDKPVTLLHDRPWTVEWKAKGSWGTGNHVDEPMLFATVFATGSAAPNAVYLWRNNDDKVVFGNFDLSVDGGRHMNYGVDLIAHGYELSDDAYYTYRIQNKITYNKDGSYASNMAYLYLDGVEVGPMNESFIANTANGTSDWINGKDFVFSYFGNKGFYLEDLTIDYIQVWEDGEGVNTDRLDYLLANTVAYRTDYQADLWEAYQNAMTSAKAVKKDITVNQSKIDEAVDAIIAARNKLVSDDYSGTSIIHSAELVTGTYARYGKQTGLKIVTSPDIAQVCIGTQDLTVVSSQIQDILMDGVETTVKVWLVSFTRVATAGEEDKTITYGIGAWTSYDESHNGKKDSKPDAYQSISIPYRSKYVTGISIAKQPTKLTYYVGEIFDSTGLELTVYWNDGSSTTETTDYFIQEGALNPSNTFVTVNYDGAVATIPVRVAYDVSGLSAVANGETVLVGGYYVGVADEGQNSDKEILLKDRANDTIIAIRNDYTDLPTDYAVGDELLISGTINVDGSSSTPNKRYVGATSIEVIGSGEAT